MLVALAAAIFGSCAQHEKDQALPEVHSVTEIAEEQHNLSELVLKHIH